MKVLQKETNQTALWITQEEHTRHANRLLCVSLRLAILDGGYTYHTRLYLYRYTRAFIITGLYRLYTLVFVYNTIIIG